MSFLTPSKTNQRGKNRGRSMILTDIPVKTAHEAEAATMNKTTSCKVARTLVSKKEVKSAKRQIDKEEEKWHCLVCDEPFGNSRPREKWVSCTDCGKWAYEDCTSGDRCYVRHNCNPTNAFEIAITSFGIWYNKMFDFNSHQWCFNLPRCARQPAPHMGQVDAGALVSHNT